MRNKTKGYLLAGAILTAAGAAIYGIGTSESIRYERSDQVYQGFSNVNKDTAPTKELVFSPSPNAERGLDTPVFKGTGDPKTLGLEGNIGKKFNIVVSAPIWGRPKVISARRSISKRNR